jgi:hypothetical protein
LEKELRKYYLIGFVAKYIGLALFLAIYILVFKNGDTFMYYQSASQIWNSFLTSPLEGLNKLMLDSGEFYLSDFDAKTRFFYFESPSE